MAMLQAKSPAVYVGHTERTNIRFEKDIAHIDMSPPNAYVNAQEVADAMRDSLSGFVGQINTPQTQALMKHHLEEMMIKSAESYGAPSSMIMPESTARKYAEYSSNNRLYDEIKDLKKELRASNEKINTLEREIEYYKMLTEEN